MNDEQHTMVLKIHIAAVANHNGDGLSVGRGDDQAPQNNESQLKVQKDLNDQQPQTTLQFDKSLIRKHNATTLRIK